MGVSLAVGVPGSGKTFRFLKEWRASARPGRRLIVDPLGACKDAGLRPVRSFSEAVALLKRGRAARWIPHSKKHAEPAWWWLAQAPPMSVLIDECAPFKRSERLQDLLRVWRHHGHSYWLTTQHLSGDSGQVLLSVAEDLCVYRTIAPESLKMLRSTCGLEVAQVRSFRDWHGLRRSAGGDWSPIHPKRK